MLTFNDQGATMSVLAYLDNIDNVGYQDEVIRLGLYEQVHGHEESFNSLRVEELVNAEQWLGIPETKVNSLPATRSRVYKSSGRFILSRGGDVLSSIEIVGERTIDSVSLYANDRLLAYVQPNANRCVIPLSIPTCNIFYNELNIRIDGGGEEIYVFSTQTCLPLKIRNHIATMKRMVFTIGYERVEIEGNAIYEKQVSTVGI